MKISTLSLSFILLLIISLIGGCASEEIPIKQSIEVMGTIATITVYHNDIDSANAAINEAFQILRDIDDTLSTYKNTSEVYILNTQKMLRNPSEDLLFNIKRSIAFGELSKGSFDITVQPILELYRESFSERQGPPTPDEIEQTVERVDFRRIYLNVSIEIGEDQKITLGGIAKGYAIDKAIEKLEKHGIKSALVDIGGDIKTIDRKPDGSDWTIAIANPRNNKDYIAILSLNNVAIATSGDYERYFDEDITFHHIVDPRTGYSATELISVTIIADEAMDADAVATSAFVMGQQEGLVFIEMLDGIEGLIINSDKEIIKSSNFDKFIIQ